MIRLFASITLSDTDKRALVILLILLVVALLFIGLIGMAIRGTMIHQSKRADAMMHDVAKAHVINNPRAFRIFGTKKNNRALYRDSLIPFAIALVATITLLIFNLATSDWSHNIFEECKELFFEYDWVGTTEDPVFVKIFGISVISRWPDVTHTPEFKLEHLCSYIVVFLYVVSWLYYAYVCQAYIAREVMIIQRSNTIYHKSLEGFNANADVNIKPENPIPPSD